MSLAKSEAILAANTARCYPPGIPTDYWGSLEAFQHGKARAVEAVVNTPELEACG